MSTWSGKTPKPCQCGCGGTTKGGQWLQGHNRVSWAARRPERSLEMREAEEQERRRLERAGSLPPHSWDWTTALPVLEQSDVLAAWAEARGDDE